ncbi:RNA methyltransferase, partial [Pontimonas sp.]|nr:RNA methyltransferase [Pontimonas sp.]
PEEGLYIAESLKVLGRALSAGHHPRSIITTQQWVTQLTELEAEHPGLLAHTPVYVGSADILEKLTGFHVHRGTLASMARPALPSVASLVAEARRVVVLEDIVDHTNVGAVFRSVAGLGADAVIVSPSCADPLYRRSVRVSMGTVMQVPWTRAHSYADWREALRDAGFHVAALALEQEARGLDELAIDAHDRLAIVLGTEGDGLSAEAVEGADSVVAIPMDHGVDSLNVAAASAVALWALR